MKYIVNSFGGIKVQNCKRKWIEIICEKNNWKFKVKDIFSIQGYTNKVKINDIEYFLLNGTELEKKIKENEQIKEKGG